MNYQEKAKRVKENTKMQKSILIRWYNDDLFLQREINSYLNDGYKFIDFIVTDRLSGEGILIVE